MNRAVGEPALAMYVDYKKQLILAEQWQITILFSQYLDKSLLRVHIF